MLLEGKIVPGTEGLTLGEIREEVLKGGRFVIYTWVVSVIVMTFRRSSGIRFIRRLRKPSHGASFWKNTKSASLSGELRPCS